jgi:phage terminase large subunit-like protein
VTRRYELAELIAWLASMPRETQEKIVGEMPEGVRRTLNEAWDIFALEGQAAPLGDWRVWLIQAGRGYRRRAPGRSG